MDYRIDDIRRKIAENTAEEELQEVKHPLMELIRSEILERNAGRTYLENLDRVIEKGVVPAGKLKFNVYPLGKKDEELHPEYLAICRGNETLNHYLKAVDKHLQEMEVRIEMRSGRAGVESVVFLLTDKWDPKVFDKFGSSLTSHFIKGNMWIVILLVTDYGVAQIPFLPNDEATRSDLRQRISSRNIIGTRSYGELMLKQRGEKIEYYEGIGFSKEHDKDKKGGASYRFDVDALYWRADKPGEPHTEGKIPVKALQELFRKIGWIADCSEKELTQKAKSEDQRECTLDIFGKHVIWKKTGDDGDRFADIMKAMKEFITICDQHRL